MVRFLAAEYKIRYFKLTSLVIELILKEVLLLPLLLPRFSTEFLS